MPPGARQGLVSASILLFGFTVFTATVFAGGTMGMALDVKTLIRASIAGNLLLGLYAALLGCIACRSALNSVLMGRFCFGESGGRRSDFLLGFTQVGWYVRGSATVAVVRVKMLGLPQAWTMPLMVLFGFCFGLTAFIGYEGLDRLWRAAIPAMLALLPWSPGVASREVGSLGGLLAIEPKESMGWHMAITLVFGTFVSGATQATDWSRFARHGKTAVLPSLVGFFIGNGLMILVGAYGAMVHQQPDIVEVMVLQGLSIAAVVMLFPNIWATQDNILYNVAVAGCNRLHLGRQQALKCADA